MFSDKSVYLFLLATSLGLISVGTAFTTPSFAGVNTRRTVFGVASTPLYVSDEEAAVSTTMDENVDAPVDLQEEASAATIPEISSEEAHTDVVGNVDSLDASPELTPEEQAAANKRKVERERHTLFVGNLPFDIPEDEVKVIFEQHGTVQLLTAPKDQEGRNRGFLFIDMSSEDELQACIDALDGTGLGGRSIKVTRSLPKEQLSSSKDMPASWKKDAADGMKKLYMGNIPFTATEEEIREYYQQFGSVKEVFVPRDKNSGEGRGFAFVTMAEEDIQQAIEATNGADFGGRNLVVNEPLPVGKKAPSRGRRTSDRGTKLYVGNLSYYTVTETLEELFGEFGEVLDCYLPEDPASGGSRGFGFVTMMKEDAERAIADLDQCEVDGRTIRVNEAQPKGRKSEVYNDDNDMGSGSWDNSDQ